MPWEKLGSYLRGVRESAERNGIEIVAFGHAGDGHVHVNALVDTTIQVISKIESVLLHTKRQSWQWIWVARQVASTATVRLRTRYLEQLYGEEIVGLFKSVKKIFDPHGILNPGIIVPNGVTEDLCDLKVGKNSVSYTGKYQQKTPRHRAFGRMANSQTHTCRSLTITELNRCANT